MKKILIFILVLISFSPFFKVDAATASFFTSGGGTVYVGDTFNVTVFANGSDSYNGAQVDVNFSNLNYVGVSAAAGWTCVGGPSRSGDTVSSGGCVLLGSSTTGSKALLNLTFRAFNTPSTGTITASGTITLADGSGTKVSGGGNTVTYTAVNPPPPPPQAPGAVTVTSTSHPDPNLWYSNVNLSLAWNKDDGVDGFSYVLDTVAATVPPDTITSADATFTSTNLKEGYNFFHIKAHNNVGFGPVAVFQVNLDITPPDPFAIAKLDNSTKDKYVIYFATNDKLSGVKDYTVSLDGKDLGVQNSGLEIDKTVKKVTVTATDKAGNKLSEDLNIAPATEAEATVPQSTFDLKTAAITLGILLLVLLLAFGAYLLYKRMKKAKKVTPTVV